MFYPRNIYPELIEHIEKRQVSVLTGMRRTGKTFMVQQLLKDIPNKNSLYYDLQKADIRELFSQKNYDLIREAFIARGLNPNKQMIIAIDEIQLLPDIPGVIKYLYDHYNIKFIVTGSSSYYLKNLFSESMAGRKKIFELYPLNFGEYLKFKSVSFNPYEWEKAHFMHAEYNRLSGYYEDFIHFGGFPEVVLAESEKDKKNLLEDIISAYLSIDVRSLADFSDEQNIYKLARLLAGRVGSKVDYSKIASILGLSRHTITNYIYFFKKTYMIHTVSAYSESDDRILAKAEKLYFCDTGLANHLAELSSGAQFENSLFNQLRHMGEIQYFSLKSGQEIDFILNRKLALEAKETPIQMDLNILKRTANKAGIKELRLVGRHVSPKFKDYVWGGSIL